MLYLVKYGIIWHSCNFSSDTSYELRDGSHASQVQLMLARPDLRASRNHKNMFYIHQKSTFDYFMSMAVRIKLRVRYRFLLDQNIDRSHKACI